jgi:hypothetical protein
MVPNNLPLVSGSWLSLLLPLAIGLFFAFLAGRSAAAFERRALTRAATRFEQPREKPAAVPRAA